MCDSKYILFVNEIIYFVVFDFVVEFWFVAEVGGENFVIVVVVAAWGKWSVIVGGVVIHWLDLSMFSFLFKLILFLLRRNQHRMYIFLIQLKWFRRREYKRLMKYSTFLTILTFRTSTGDYTLLKILTFDLSCSNVL